MSILLWILCIHLATVAITAPLLTWDARKAYEEKPEVFGIFNPTFIGIVASCIPIYNLYNWFPIFVKWASIKFITRKLKKSFKKNYKSNPDPEFKEQREKIITILEDFLNTKN
jgi:hypothetical protein